MPVCVCALNAPAARPVSSYLRHLDQVHGRIPSWLCGDYVKQSASKFEEPHRTLTHVFDGYGKVLRWRLRGGRATLQAPTHV